MKRECWTGWARVESWPQCRTPSSENPDGSAAGHTLPAAWQSADGQAWARVPLPPGGPGEAIDVATSGAVTMIVGTVSGYPISFDNSFALWLASGPGGASEDDSDGRLHSVTWTGDRFIIAGQMDGRASLWETPDGTNFAPVPIDPLVDTDETARFQSVASVGDTIVLAAPSEGTRSLGQAPVWARINGRWERTLDGAVHLSTWGDRIVASGCGLWISDPIP